MKKIFFIVFTIQLIFTVSLSAQNIVVVTPPEEYLNINADNVKNIIEQNYQKLKLSNHITKIYYTKKPDYFILVKLNRFSYGVSFAYVKIDGNSLTIINNNYTPNMTDFEIYQKESALQKTTSGSYDFLFDTECENYPTAVSAINTVTNYAENQNYSVNKLIGSQATISAVQNTIINNDLIAMGNVGHGSTTGIWLEDGFLSYTWFASHDLSGEIYYFNSCNVFNNPLKSAILNDGNARTFIGGAVSLPVGTSEEVFKDFFDYTLNDGWEMDDALEQAEINNNLVNYHGLGGDGSIMNLTTNGSLRGNEIWSGNVTVTGNVTVPSGISLTIKSGTNQTYQNNASLIINGSLDVNGTTTEPINFTRDENNNLMWGGIKVYGDANVSHAIIEHADKGVQFNSNSSGSVSNSEIKNNNYGIYVYKSKPTIQNCEIHDNDSRGIYLSSTNYISGDAQILNNQIYDNDEYGIDMHQSSPDIRGNEIYNHDYGISCYGYSSPYLGEYNIRGNNEIHDNEIGLEAFDLCDPFLGQENCDPDGGYNSFEDNDYHVWAEMDCYVQAEENWWGSNPPNSGEFYIEESDIDYNPWLHSAPSGSSMLAKGAGEAKVFDSSFNQTRSEDPVSSGDFMSYYDPKWPIEQKLLFARNISHLGDIKNAQAICKEIIETFPDSSLSLFGLDIVWESSRDEKAPEGYDLAAFKEYVTKLAANKDNKEIYDHAALVQAGFDQGKSISIYDNVYNENKGNSLSEVALYDKFMRYYQDGDMGNAQQIATQLEKEYPKSISARKTQSQMSGISPEMKKENSSDENAAIPVKYSIGANYPNPFNPSTTIRYQVPAVANVQFKIYNSLGQVIKTYSENKSKGSHIFIWNGKNNNGINVPSGLYILKFKAQSLETDRTAFSKFIKMLLIR